MPDGGIPDALFHYGGDDEGDPDNQLAAADIMKELGLSYHVNIMPHPDGQFALSITNKYIRWGASPRAAQTLALGAKVRALLDARYNVSFEDVRRVFLPGLRHRIIVNFEAQAEGVQPDQVLLELLQNVPEKAEG